MSQTRGRAKPKSRWHSWSLGRGIWTAGALVGLLLVMPVQDPTAESAANRPARSGDQVLAAMYTAAPADLIVRHESGIARRASPAPTSSPQPELLPPTAVPALSTETVRATATATVLPTPAAAVAGLPEDRVPGRLGLVEPPVASAVAASETSAEIPPAEPSQPSPRAAATAGAPTAGPSPFPSALAAAPTSVPLPTPPVATPPAPTVVPSPTPPVAAAPPPTAVPSPTPPVAPTSTAVPAPPVAQPTAGVAPVVPVVPTQPPIVQPLGSRNGPSAVISQIPSSAWQWLDTHGWKVDWRQGPGPGRLSEAQYATSTIVLWYDTTSWSDTTWAGAFAHELGHAVSYVHFSNQQMNEWNAMRGLSSWRWVPGTANDFSVGEGDFAEAFMSYLLGHPVRSVGGPLTATHRAWIAANTPF